MSKPINISVPDDLYLAVKKHKQVKVSSVCQKALLDVIQEKGTKATRPKPKDAETDRLGKLLEKIVECIDRFDLRDASNSKPTLSIPDVDAGLVTKGAIRLIKDLAPPALAYYEKCHKAGQEWAANEASLEKLNEIFETQYFEGDLKIVINNIPEMTLIFDGSAIARSIPGEMRRKDVKDYLVMSFYEGAKEMFFQMTGVLKEYGYELEKEELGKEKVKKKYMKDIREEKYKSGSRLRYFSDLGVDVGGFSTLVRKEEELKEATTNKHTDIKGLEYEEKKYLLATSRKELKRGRDVFEDKLDLSSLNSLDEVKIAVLLKCKRFGEINVGKINDGNFVLSLTLFGMSPVYAELIKGKTLKKLQEKIMRYFPGDNPEICVDLKLEMNPEYDFQSTHPRDSTKGKLKQRDEFFYDLDAEQAIISACLKNSIAISEALRILNEDDFHKTAHQTIFKNMKALFEVNQPVGILGLADRMRQNNELESAGGINYLSQLEDFVPTATYVTHHAKIVREKKILRDRMYIEEDLVDTKEVDEDEII